MQPLSKQQQQEAVAATAAGFNQFEKSPQSKSKRRGSNTANGLIRPSPRVQKKEEPRGFFDPLITRSLDFVKPTAEILKIWDSNCEAPDTHALMLVRSTSLILRTSLQQNNPASHANPNGVSGQSSSNHNTLMSPIYLANQGGVFSNAVPNSPSLAAGNKSAHNSGIDIDRSGGRRKTQLHQVLMYCVLCSEHLFLFSLNSADNFEMGGGGVDYETLIQNAPDYYLNIEFAKLTVIKHEETQAKCGFTLQLRERSHDFLIQTAPPPPATSQQQQNNGQGSSVPATSTAHSGDGISGKNPTSVKEPLNPRNQLSQLDVTAGGKNMLASQSGIGVASGHLKTMQSNASACAASTPGGAQQQPQQQQRSVGGGLESFENRNGSTGQNNGQEFQIAQLQQENAACKKQAAEELKYLFKSWMRCLNEYVVRSENLKKYNVVEQIGIGGQARVYKIMGKNPSFYPAHLVEEMKQLESFNRTYAIKIISKKKFDQMDKSERYQMLDEIRIMRNLKNCGNTLKLIKIYESDSYLNLLMEYQEGGTLGDRLEKNVKFTEEEAKMIAAQLLLTIDFMSLKGIIHRDLKPENILMNSKKDGVFDIRVADFGFAAIFDVNNPLFESTFDRYVCGTAGYICPEAFEGRGYSPRSDVFSVGSILFSLLAQKNLFTGRDYISIMESNKQCNLNELIIKMRNLSPDARDLLPQMLQKDPAKRITAKQALLHNWFSQEHIAVQSSLNVNSVLAKNSNGTIPQLQMLMHSGSISNNNQSVMHSLSIHSKNPQLTMRNQLHIHLRKGTQEHDGQGFVGPAGAAGQPGANKVHHQLSINNNRLHVRQISLANQNDKGSLNPQRMQSIQPALQNQNSINPTHNQNPLQNKTTYGNISVCPIGGTIGPGGPVGQGTQSNVVNSQNKQIMPSQFNNYLGPNNFLPGGATSPSPPPGLKNQHSLNTPALQNKKSLNPSLQNQNSLNHHVQHMNSLNPALQNMNSLNPAVSKRSDTLSSQRSFLPIRRDLTIDSQANRNISQRSEIVQQFNYYKIISDYKKNKVQLQQVQQSPPPSILGQRQQYSQFLELPTGKGGRTSSNNQVGLALQHANSSFHQMMEQQNQLLFCISESNIAQHSPFIQSNSGAHFGASGVMIGGTGINVANNHHHDDRDSSGMRFSPNHVIDASNQHLDLFNNSKFDQPLNGQSRSPTPDEEHKQEAAPPLSRRNPIQLSARRKSKILKNQQIINQAADGQRLAPPQNDGGPQGPGDTPSQRQNLRASGVSSKKGVKKGRRGSNVGRVKGPALETAHPDRQLKESVTPKVLPDIQIQVFTLSSNYININNQNDTFANNNPNPHQDVVDIVQHAAAPSGFSAAFGVGAVGGGTDEIANNGMPHGGGTGSALIIQNHNSQAQGGGGPRGLAAGSGQGLMTRGSEAIGISKLLPQPQQHQLGYQENLGINVNFQHNILLHAPYSAGAVEGGGGISDVCIPRNKVLSDAPQNNGQDDSPKSDDDDELPTDEFDQGSQQVRADIAGYGRSGGLLMRSGMSLLSAQLTFAPAKCSMRNLNIKREKRRFLA